MLYPIYVDGVKPYYTIQRAFENSFFECHTYDWMARKKLFNNNLSRMQGEFLSEIKSKRPDYCFMQLQNPANMNVAMIREIAKYTKVINWTGDIRIDKAWYDWFEAIGREIHITLFSNMTDVEMMRDRGINADYLQVGFDHNYYFPKSSTIKYDVVFSAHNYQSFPLSKLRCDVALALREEFKDRFKLYGGGWAKFGFKQDISNNEQEANAYRSAKIGISVSNFDFKRYHSDRLLRIMACGAMPLSHNYLGLDLDYTDGENIATFDTPQQAVDKCKYYLSNESERVKIARSALEFVQQNCTWHHRVSELIQILNNHE